MEKTLFEKFGGSYCNVNDHTIPKLILPGEEEKPVGIFGKRDLRYLRNINLSPTRICLSAAN